MTGEWDERPILPLRTVIRMLRAARRGWLSESPVRFDHDGPRTGWTGWGRSERAASIERRVLRAIGAHQLLAHRVPVERAARIIGRVRRPTIDEPLTPATVEGMASMGRLYVQDVERVALRLKPAGWRPPRCTGAGP
jgi:hypothetical protein